MGADVLPSTFAALCLALVLAMAASALCGFGSGRAARIAATVFSALELSAVAALGVFGLTARATTLTLPTLWAAWPLTIGDGRLSGFFLVVLALVAAAAALYAPRYMAHYSEGQQRAMRVLVPLFIGAMALVLLARDAIGFLVVWEMMSLSSFGLVVTERDKAAVRRAGLVYLVATHLSALALLAMFGVLAAHGLGTTFAAYATGLAFLPRASRSLVFLLALIGFGSKAAVTPMHLWLPRAHPQAPSQVSALMSGVMVKVAIYGLVLATFGWLGAGPLWWGVLLLGLGAASALLGVLYALMEHDLKALLAYHTVENVGIILLGVGAAEVARTAGLSQVAALALAAALFHVLNHALFKSGLFLAAGTVKGATGTAMIGRLGGLAATMPWTAGAFFVLSMAISALPPFNGFASEWLTLQVLLRLGHASLPVAAAALTAALALALTGGLAGACFVKASGVAFLGPPRSAAAAAAREGGWPMFVAPGLLAAACLALGLLPGAVVRVGLGVCAQVTGIAAAAPASLALATPWTAPEWPLFLLLGGMAAAFALAMALGRSLGRGPVQPAWACGGVLTPDNAYTSDAYTKSFRQIFAGFYQPQRALERTPTVLPYLSESVRYESVVRHVIDHHLYRPVLQGGIRLAHRLRRLQSGSLRHYVAYLLVTLLVGLVLYAR